MGREEDVPGGGGVGASLLVIDLLNGGPTGVRFFFLHVYV